MGYVDLMKGFIHTPIETEEDKLYAQLKPTDSQWIAMRLSLVSLWVSISAERKICKYLEKKSFMRNLLGVKITIYIDRPMPLYERFFLGMMEQYVAMSAMAGMGACDFISNIFREPIITDMNFYVNRSNLIPTKPINDAMMCRVTEYLKEPNVQA